MSRPYARVYIADIHTNLILVQDFTQGYGYVDFRPDIKLQIAVIRCFEVIGDEAKRVARGY